MQNAVDQAKIAAATIYGNETSYHSLPWIWSDQYDVKLQIAGLSRGYDKAVIAVDAVNKPQELMLGKRLITGREKADKNKPADESVPMKIIVQV